MLAQAGPQERALSRSLGRILAGERDRDSLCEELLGVNALIVEIILAGLADLSTLENLLREGGEGA